MVEKKKISLMILISGILCLISIIIPSFIYIGNYWDVSVFWLFGLTFEFDPFGFGFMSALYWVPGVFYSLLILILACLLIIIGILTLVEKNIPHGGVLLIIVGIFLVATPFLIRSTISLIQIIMDSGPGVVEIFGLTFNFIILWILIAGVLSTISGIYIKRGA